MKYRKLTKGIIKKGDEVRYFYGQGIWRKCKGFIGCFAEEVPQSEFRRPIKKRKEK